jgi:hypothetical protein
MGRKSNSPTSMAAFRQPILLQRGAHPPREAGPQGFAGVSVVAAKRLQLPGGRKAHVHQLHFVHDPQAVLVEQAEFHGPAGAGSGVTPIHGTGQQHVLGADQNRTMFRVEMPFPSVRTAHEQVHAD